MVILTAKNIQLGGITALTLEAMFREIKIYEIIFYVALEIACKIQMYVLFVKCYAENF